jgi:hypothetical protein
MMEHFMEPCNGSLIELLPMGEFLQLTPFNGAFIIIFFSDEGDVNGFYEIC